MRGSSILGLTDKVGANPWRLDMTAIAETIRLSAHEKFIIDGIKRQAGSVEKAVLELVMNAIEAQLHSRKNPVVNIDFSVEDDQAKLVVRDLGRGFKTRNEIEQWFAKFGTPHNECPQCQKTMTLKGDSFICQCGYQTEGRTWAEFRMGRGQAFSFGRNVWRTGQFRMEYDLETHPDERTYAHIDGTENHVLDFQLQSNLPNQIGCEVEVYFYDNPVGKGKAYPTLDAFKSKIKHHIEFMEGEITFNGEQINTPASELSWDVETEDAFFMFGKGHKFSLYNIGAFVNDHSASDFGVTGVAVSKVKLVVNFARNDVMQSCKVWKRIREIVRRNKAKKIRRSSRWLTEDERISTLLELRDGYVDYDDVKGLGLLELTDGKKISLDKVRRIRSHWTFADRGDRIADRLMYLGEAVCLSDETLERLDYTGEPKLFFDWLLKEYFGDDLLQEQWLRLSTFYKPFGGESGLSSGIKNEHRLVSIDRLSKGERRFLKVMEAFDCWKRRTLCIGVSGTANGWTDGSTYIAFNREYLQRWNPNYHTGAAAMVTLAFHEMAHDSDDTGTHLHSVEFYQSYHDITRGGALHIIGRLPSKMGQVKWQDQAAEQAEKEAKKKDQRDVKLGIKQVVTGQVKAAKAIAADGITHTPTKPKAVVVKRKKKHHRRAF